MDTSYTDRLGDAEMILANEERCDLTGDGGDWIELHTGNAFTLDKPVFRIEEIAHSLSLLCRFNGHTSRFYSVAEHSLLVAHLMEYHVGGDPLEGLLHDATEAYLGDVPAPLKIHLPDWKAVDKELEKKMRLTFGLPEVRSKECLEADTLALLIEAYYLMPSRGRTYLGFLDQLDRAEELAKEGTVWRCVLAEPPPHVAAEWFMEQYENFTA